MSSGTEAHDPSAPYDGAPPQQSCSRAGEENELSDPERLTMGRPIC